MATFCLDQRHWSARLRSLSVSRYGRFQRYDRDNGLVFTETTVSASKRNHDSAGAQQSVTSGKVSTLVALTTRTALRYIHHLPPDSLSDLPWLVAKQMWLMATEEQRSGLLLWKAFAGAGHASDVAAYHRIAYVVLEKCPLEYFKDVTSPDCQWMTCLTISKLELGGAKYMSGIASISNLLALDLRGPEIHSIANDTGMELSTRSIFQWAAHVREAKAFSHLRILLLRHQTDLGPEVFQWLAEFPSLTLVGFQNCNISSSGEAVARRYGFSCEDDRQLLNKIQDDMARSHTWDGALKACVDQVASPDPLAPSSQSPLLNVRLGPTSADVVFARPLIFFRKTNKPLSTLAHPHLLSVQKSSAAMLSGADPPPSTLNNKTSNTNLKPLKTIKAEESTEHTLMTYPPKTIKTEEPIEHTLKKYPPESDSSILQPVKRRRVRAGRLLNMNDLLSSTIPLSTSSTLSPPPSADMANSASNLTFRPTSTSTSPDVSTSANDKTRTSRTLPQPRKILPQPPLPTCSSNHTVPTSSPSRASKESPPQLPRPDSDLNPRQPVLATSTMEGYPTARFRAAKEEPAARTMRLLNRLPP